MAPAKITITYSLLNTVFLSVNHTMVAVKGKIKNFGALGTEDNGSPCLQAPSKNNLRVFLDILMLRKNITSMQLHSKNN